MRDFNHFECCEIVLCAALRIKDKDIIVPCFRHGNGFGMLHDLGIKVERNNIEQGFMTAKGHFLTREQAYIVAMNNGQLSATTKQHKRDNLEHELYSEDLY